MNNHHGSTAIKNKVIANDQYINHICVYYPHILHKLYINAQKMQGLN